MRKYRKFQAHFIGAFIILFLITNACCASTDQLFEYTSNIQLNEKQQHYADAWITKEYVKSYRYVRVNTHLFEKNDMKLDLPFNASLVVEKSKLITHTEDLFTWVGNFKGNEGTAAFEVNGQMVTARISNEDYTYLLYPLTGDMHVLLLCGEYPNDESDEGYRLMLERGIKHAMENNAQRIDPETGSPIAAVAGDCRVRVLVAYTDDAAANLADPIAFVNSCITATNVAYDNSIINFNVELAVAIEEVYAESINSNTDVSRFQDGTDGFMDDVMDYRGSFDADLNILITENLESGICGLAYTADNSPYAEAFCVVSRGCAVGNLSFPHELGHLYGCRHDPYVDNSNSPYAFGHGYVYLPGSWRTIMAYNDYCTDNGGNCTRLQYFSNPALTYSGHAMGVNGANDNESAIESSRANISSLEVTVPNKIFPFSLTFSSGEYADVIATNSVNNTNTYTYLNGSQGSWRSGSSIVMSPGFNALAGSIFHAFIDGCTPLRPAATNENGLMTRNKSGIFENQSTHEIQVYPNPASNFITVNISSSESKVLFKIYNSTMQLVKLLNFESGLENKISTSDLSPDIYFINAQTDGQYYKTKFVVSR